MVELKTTIAQGLHVTDDSAGYDAACKRVLSEKAILARIMKSCLEEYKDCDVNDIAEKYIEGQPQVSAVPVLPDEGGTVISGMDTEDKSVREGTVTYDIRFRAIVPDDCICNVHNAVLVMTFASAPSFPTPRNKLPSSSTWRPRTIFTPAIR